MSPQAYQVEIPVQIAFGHGKDRWRLASGGWIDQMPFVMGHATTSKAQHRQPVQDHRRIDPQSILQRGIAEMPDTRIGQMFRVVPREMV